MPIYAKPVKATNARFRGRETIVMTSEESISIPIPDDVVLCNGCNENVAEGYLVYLGRRELQQDHPYDIYCKQCLNRYFPRAVMV